MVKRDQGSKGIAGRALCGPRIGAAARSVVDSASDLAAGCGEGTAHFVPETMTQVDMSNFSEMGCLTWNMGWSLMECFMYLG